MARPADALRLADARVAAAVHRRTPPTIGRGRRARRRRRPGPRGRGRSPTGCQGRAADGARRCVEAGLPHVAAILAADPVPGNPAGAMPVAFCLALVLGGPHRRGRGHRADAPRLASTTAPGRCGRSPARWPPGWRCSPGTSTRPGALADDALDHLPRDRPAAGEPLARRGAGQRRRAGGRDRAGAAGARRGRGRGRSPPLYAFETRLARGWLHAAGGRTSAAQAEAVRTADAGRRRRAWTRYALFALHDLARFGAAADAAERLAGRCPTTVDGPYVDAGRSPTSTPWPPRCRRRWPRSSRRFEAMGAVLLAAEAAAAAADGPRDRRPPGERGHRARPGRVLAAALRQPGRPRRCATSSATPVLGTLTAREREVIELAARGLTNREIGEQLFVSVRTVNTHLYRAYAKLGVNDRVQLAALLGLVPPA